MYDRVSKKLFGNQGTGSFVLGPDVAKPIMGIWRYHDIYSASGYIRDGLVAMWDGIENAGWGKHDPNATVWKELISGVNNFTDIGQGKWDNNSVSVVPRIQTVSRFGAEVKTIEMVLDIGAYAPVTNKTCINLPVDTGNATQLKFWGYPSGGANTILIGGFQSLPVCGDYFPRHISMSFDSNAILTDIYFDGQAPQRGISDYHYATYSQIRIGTPNAAGRAYNIRGYNRVLSYNERQYNLHIDKVRFNLP